MKKITWVYLGIALLVLVPLAAQQGNVLRLRSSVTVLDAKGKTVGTLIDTVQYNGPRVPTVAFKSGQDLVFAGVRPDHFIGLDGQLVFATADCSGTPYFIDPTYYGLPRSLIPQSFVSNDGTFFAVGAGSIASTVTVQSAFE